jgi:hypothetical protein
MKSWVGRTANDLILELGPPTRTTSDGKGGQVLIYGGEQVIRTNRNGAVYSTRESVREYYVNEDGIIYSWRWQGL